MGTAKHGNRRTDEQGTLNFEVPEQYFFNHALERSGKIIFRRKIGEAGSRHGRKSRGGIFLTTEHAENTETWGGIF